MMRFARVECPSCHHLTEEAVVDDHRYYVECDACHQRNMIQGETLVITGRCWICGFPIDDHRLTADGVAFSCWM